TDLLPGLSSISYVSGDGNIANVLEPGEIWIYTATYQVNQDDINAGIVTNQADVAALAPNGDTITDISGTDVDSDIATRLIICQEADITLYKVGEFMDENSDGLANVGETIVYTFSVLNTGNVTLYDVKIDDTFLQLVGYPVTPNTLEPGETGFATYTYTITQNDINEGGVYNIAFAYAVDSHDNVVEDSSEDTDPLSVDDP